MPDAFYFIAGYFVIAAFTSFVVALSNPDPLLDVPPAMVGAFWPLFIIYEVADGLGSAVIWVLELPVRAGHKVRAMLGKDV